MPDKQFRLTDPNGFITAHSANHNIYNFIKKHSPIDYVVTVYMNSSGHFREWRCGNVTTEAALTNTELSLYFTEISDASEFVPPPQSKIVGEMKIILTYNDGKTLEEEGVYFIDLTDAAVTYKYNRKKLGFLKYNGEVSLLINELKQITINSEESTTVLHIEEGIVQREHVMYDDERKFKGRQYNRKG